MRLKIFVLCSYFVNAGVPGDGFIAPQEELRAKLKYDPIVFDDVKYEDFYLEKLELSIHDSTISNDEVHELNTKWLKSISEDQKKFINSMINTWKTVPIQEFMLDHMVEPTEYCWAILVYNSDDLEAHEGNQLEFSEMTGTSVAEKSPKFIWAYVEA